MLFKRVIYEQLICSSSWKADVYLAESDANCSVLASLSIAPAGTTVIDISDFVGKIDSTGLTHGRVNWKKKRRRRCEGIFRDDKPVR